MKKKLFITIILAISILLWNSQINLVNADALKSLREGDICSNSWTGKINCPQFQIETSNFSPWSGDILEKAKEWWWDAVGTANAILSLIIKNLIVVFWVLSLLMMTIGWGMMIMHAGQESILTKWKSIFMYWIISLVVWLSAGIIVKLVSYFLY